MLVWFLFFSLTHTVLRLYTIAYFPVRRLSFLALLLVEKYTRLFTSSRRKVNKRKYTAFFEWRTISLIIIQRVGITIRIHGRGMYRAVCCTMTSDMLRQKLPPSHLCVSFPSATIVSWQSARFILVRADQVPFHSSSEDHQIINTVSRKLYRGDECNARSRLAVCRSVKDFVVTNKKHIWARKFWPSSVKHVKRETMVVSGKRDACDVKSQRAGVILYMSIICPERLSRNTHTHTQQSAFSWSRLCSEV